MILDCDHFTQKIHPRQPRGESIQFGGYRPHSSPRGRITGHCRFEAIFLSVSPSATTHELYSPAIVGCVAKLTFKKVFDLTDLPGDWSVVRMASDWFGQPLVLIEDGKPKKPDPPFDTATWVSWLHAKPRAHHLLYTESGSRQHLRLEGEGVISTFHMQPIEDGWLIGDRRGPVGLYDHTGVRRRSLDLGDASEDVQTAPDGRIWVSYFDEGVFGGTIAKQGVVCFDLNGTPQFRYADFAQQNKLPFVADCYAMNVVSSRDVWLSYYMDFPLVHIVDGALKETLLDFGCLGNGFAVRNEQVLYSRDAEILTKSLVSSSPPESIQAIDENDNALVPLVAEHTGFVGRGNSALLNTGKAIYRLA